MPRTLTLTITRRSQKRCRFTKSDTNQGLAQGLSIKTGLTSLRVSSTRLECGEYLTSTASALLLTLTLFRYEDKFPRLSLMLHQKYKNAVKVLDPEEGAMTLSADAALSFLKGSQKE